MNSEGTQPYINMYPFSPKTPLPSRLPHDIEQSFMCYTVGPCWLSILNIAVCACRSQTPKLFLTTTHESFLTPGLQSCPILIKKQLKSVPRSSVSGPSLINVEELFPHYKHITIVLALFG